MGVHPASRVTLDGWITDIIPKLQKSTYVLSLGHVHLPSDGCIRLLLSDALCSLPASSLGRVMLVCHVHQAGRFDCAFLCWFPLLYSPFQRFKIKSQAVHRSMKTTLKSWVIVFVCLFVCFFFFFLIGVHGIFWVCIMTFSLLVHLCIPPRAEEWGNERSGDYEASKPTVKISL